MTHSMARSATGLMPSHVDLLVAQVVDYAIVGLGVDERIVSWNAGAERVKGYTAAEAVGRHFSMFYTDEDRAAGLPARLLATARRDGRVEHTGWRVRKDGSRFWGDVVITALHDDTGTLSGYAKVTRDRTEQHALEQARTSLFAGMSHDLRTPLSAIGAYASLLPDMPADQQREVADRIGENVRRLDDMVRGLLDLARLHTVTASMLTLEELDLGAIARDAVLTCAVRLGDRRVVVDADGLHCRGDRASMLRVLENVLSNAAQYSPRGSRITIHGELRGDRAVLVVTDEGRGIHPDDLPTIFGEFVRGRLAEDADGGTGLGLASVRQLMALQSGRVWLTSTLGTGTSVTLELPLTAHHPGVVERPTALA